MKCDKHTMLLYAVTDRAWVGEQTLYQQVESALKGGATCVQLREKQLGDADFLQEAIQIHALCQPVAGLFLGFIGKSLVLQQADGFPDSVSAHAQLLCQRFTGEILSACFGQAGGNGIFYSHDA